MKSRPAKALLALVYAPLPLWCVAAIWFDGPANRWLALALICMFVAGLAAIFRWVRPFPRMAGAACVPALLLITWWMMLSPRNDRDWQPEVARLASAEIAGESVTVRNVRNFEYQSESDFDARWETRTYDLAGVRGFDLFISYWGPKNIAHTIASWEFADGRHLAVSIETRKEKGESYSAVRGFFRQYEIYYVVADERDVVGLRAGHRGEQVFLYRLNHSPETARALLEDYLREINLLAAKPEWYNALTGNCTTTIRHHAQAIGAGRSWDWRILANGHLDEMGYERKMIDTSLPFAELRRRSDITEKAKAGAKEADFSTRIRTSGMDREAGEGVK